jgi:hypothetical protein
VVLSHGVVFTTAATALVCLPLVVMVMRAPDLAVRRAWGRRARADRPALRRLDRGHLTPRAVRPSPSLEQAAAELQRLARRRTLDATYGSAKWLDARVTAYDRWLAVACDHLGVPHHLFELDGMDLDLERLRVEEALAAAGLDLPR